MTLPELRAIAIDINRKMENHFTSASEGRNFTRSVVEVLHGPFSESINPDTFVALQTPIFINHLTQIETTADEMGTDQFH